MADVELDDFFSDPPDETLRVVVQDGETTTIALRSAQENDDDEDENEETSLAMELQQHSSDSDVRVYKVLVGNGNESDSSRPSLGRIGRFTSISVEDSNRLSVPLNSDNSPMRYSSSETATALTVTVEENGQLEDEEEKSCCFISRVGSAKSNQLLRDHCKSKRPCVSFSVSRLPN